MYLLIRPKAGLGLSCQVGSDISNYQSDRQPYRWRYFWNSLRNSFPSRTFGNSEARCSSPILPNTSTTSGRELTNLASFHNAMSEDLVSFSKPSVSIPVMNSPFSPNSRLLKLFILVYTHLLSRLVERSEPTYERCLPHSLPF